MNDSTEIPTIDLHARFVMPNYGRFALALERGEGAWVWDEAGKKYLDFGAGIAVCSIGHSHPAIADAISRQARTLVHTSNLYYTRPQALLAERIAGYVGSPGRVFFCNSGAEANEALFKLARKFGNTTGAGGRFEIITCERSFHGRTLGGIAATGQQKVKVGFDPAMPGFVHVPYNDLGAMRRAVNGRTAAILIEPIQGEGGIYPATAEYLMGLRDLCDEHDLLLMFDEVQCGFGRTGDWCGWENLLNGVKLVPDAVSWAKGMAGGFPMGAMWVRDRPIEGGSLATLLGPGTHGTTFGGTPLACAAATAVFDEIESKNLLENARKLGKIALEYFKRLDSPLIREVRGCGLMIGIEVDEEKVGEAAGIPASERSAALILVDRLQRAGLLVIPSGTNTIRLLPPLNVTEEELTTALLLLGEVFQGLSATATAAGQSAQ